MIGKVLRVVTGHVQLIGKFGSGANVDAQAAAIVVAGTKAGHTVGSADCAAVARLVEVIVAVQIEGRCKGIAQRTDRCRGGRCIAATSSTEAAVMIVSLALQTAQIVA